MDTHTPRDGRTIEELGYYDPRNADPAKQVSFKLDRVQHWLNVGAQPSPTVRNLLIKAGLTVKVKRKTLKQTPYKAKPAPAAPATEQPKA